MKAHNHNELGNLTQTPSALGLDTLCVCGEREIDHNTFPGEDGRCTVLGSTCQRFTPARKPAASQRRYDVGDVIEYRDDETGALLIATVMDFGAPGWYDVSHDGRPADDDASIHESLIVREIPWSEYLDRQVA